MAFGKNLTCYVAVLVLLPERWLLG